MDHDFKTRWDRPKPHSRLPKLRLELRESAACFADDYQWEIFGTFLFLASHAKVVLTLNKECLFAHVILSLQRRQIYGL